jgi:hypothetical protein
MTESEDRERERERERGENRDAHPHAGSSVDQMTVLCCCMLHTLKMVYWGGGNMKNKN